MKKTVQINIAGILFNIEEDAYSRLSEYLKSVQKYFVAFESSEEIVADIEARIAERLLKGEDSEKVIVNLEDVNQIISRMGTIEDFEAEANMVEEEPIPAPSPSEAPKRLSRDIGRKVLSGVLAGTAHYFKIDVTWVRVLFLLLVLGSSPVTDTGLSGVFLLAYFILWLVLPKSEDLQENTTVKKFYRDSTDRVIGGVASGLSSYFGTDVTLIRILFVVFGFFGFGILAYIVLWVVGPKAVSLTQKMEMKGEPVTLENIENNIRTNFGDKNAKEENTLTKVLLFPFRIIALLFGFLGSIFKKLGPVVRILFGLFLAFFGIVILISALALTAGFFGINMGSALVIDDVVAQVVSEIPAVSGLLIFLVMAFPGLAATLGGFSLVSNRRIGTRNFWLSSLGVWVISIFSAVGLAAKVSMNYSRDAKISEEISIPASSDILVFDKDFKMNGSDFNDVKVYFVRSKEENAKIEIIKEARGASKRIAEDNAEAIQYNITFKGDTVLFPSEMNIPTGSTYRVQEVTAYVSVPENKPFKVTGSFAREIMRELGSFRYKYGIEREEIPNLVLFMDGEGELNCKDCPVLNSTERNALERSGYDELDFTERNFLEYARAKESLNLSGFEALEMSNAIEAIVRQSDTFGIEVAAERQRDLDDLDVEVRGDKLSIEFEDNFLRNREKVVVYIQMPNLSKIDLSGASKMKVLSFKNADNIDVDVSGASTLAADLEAKTVSIDAAGASRIVLLGEIDNARISASGASRIDTKDCSIGTAGVSASGASRVSIGKVESLKQSSSGASKIRTY